MALDEYRRTDQLQRQYSSHKKSIAQKRIAGTAALLDCYVGLYEHYTEYMNAIAIQGQRHEAER